MRVSWEAVVLDDAQKPRAASSTVSVSAMGRVFALSVGMHTGPRHVDVACAGRGAGESHGHDGPECQHGTRHLPGAQRLSKEYPTDAGSSDRGEQ